MKNKWFSKGTLGKKSNPGRRLIGIQKKIFTAIVGLFAMVGGGVFLVIMHLGRMNIYASMENQYRYVNANAYNRFASQYDEIDSIGDGWILSGAVQTSLAKRSLTRAEKADVKDSLSIFQGTSIDYYLYINNKFDVFSQKNLDIEPIEFYELPMVSALKDYGKTCFYWGKDEVFGSGKNHLFVLRYVRSTSLDTEPGILCLRMAPDYLEKILKKMNETECVQLLYDSAGNVCDIYNPSGYELTDKKLEWIGSQMTAKTTAISGEGLVCTSTGSKTEYSIVTYVPGFIVNRYVYEVYSVFIIAGFVAFVLIIFLSRKVSEKLTEPIREINDYMIRFDDTKFNDYLHLHTNTELDTIGSSYNAMIDRVSGLMDKVREDEKMIREQEIHSLVNQLHPHFLYNTLDTIYMLARISHEETIMKMIYALSKYLRINLSKGADEIPAARELEHVCAYMDIQKIRNDNLFDYKAVCDDSVKNLKICKLILQPLAENAVKHGFSEMTEGGFIEIHIGRGEDRLVITVENNGLPIEAAQLAQLNAMEHLPMEDIGAASKDREGGYGLINIVARLRLKYGDGVRFYYATGEKTVCTIEILLDAIEKGEKDEV